MRRPSEPGPSPETTTIQLWWRASDAQALYEKAVAGGIRILIEPFDGPFGRTFAMADPDGLLWLTDSKGKKVGVTVAKLAYVEVEPDASPRAVGFSR